LAVVYVRPKTRSPGEAEGWADAVVPEICSNCADTLNVPVVSVTAAGIVSVEAVVTP
jgi:hypothetical protein